MEIEIKEVTTKEDKKKFIQFQIDLYKGSPFFVPPIIADELETLDPDKNPVYEHAVSRLFMAYKDGKIVGRIAAIINRNEVNEEGLPKMRFGWFDFIDDIEVSTALLRKVEEMGKENGLNTVEGPVGFSNLDKAGMLLKGYDKLATIITLYNYPYYHEHMEKLGYEKANEWVEYEIPVPSIMPEKVLRFIDVVQNRYKLKVMQFKNKNEIKALADDIFDLLEKTYSELPSFVPISKKQRAYYSKKYFKFISPDFITCIADEHNKLVAFAITMPDYAKALQKANGKLFPLGWYHLLKASKKNDTASFYLIGIEPKLQGKGLTAIIFMEMFKTFHKYNIVRLETNPELEDNKSIQLLWEAYGPENHKRRRSYRKIIQ